MKRTPQFIQRHFLFLSVAGFIACLVVATFVLADTDIDPDPHVEAWVAGPENVPGLSQYTYKLQIDAGQTASGITWSTSTADATIVSGGSSSTVTVNFNNVAVFETLTCSFTAAGQARTRHIDVSVVKIDFANADFQQPGVGTGTTTNDYSAWVVENPQLAWVTTHDPGSAWAAFDYDPAGHYEPAEPMKLVKTGANDITSPGWNIKTDVTLTAPAGHASAIGRIEVGYMQHTTQSAAWAKYGGIGTLLRTGSSAADIGIDWLGAANSKGGTDVWPWYDEGSMWAPTAPTTGNTATYTAFPIVDTPKLELPSKWRGYTSGGHSDDAIDAGARTITFTLQIGARTTDSANDADKHYFQESYGEIVVNVIYPVVAGAHIVTIPSAWSIPSSPVDLPVNITPAYKQVSNMEHAFEMWDSTGP